MGDKDEAPAIRRQPPGQYRGYRQSGIRLTEDVLPNVVAHRTQSGMAILYAVHAFDKAHLVMLAEQELIPLDAAAAMLETLRATEEEGIENARRQAGGGMHSAEYLLIQRLGEQVGGHLPLARSSGDLGAVAMRIVQRDKLLEVMADLNNMRAVLLDVADKHTESVMPGYQQTQPAQPTTLAHYLAAWAAVLERDFERALGLYRRTNLSPAGSAIMTGSNFDVSRHRTAELLGFDGPTANTFDAIMSHDLLVEGFSYLAILNADLARLADDLMLWSTHEFGFVEIPDRFCGTSSILMQAKNPYTPQYVKGLAAASVGALVTAFLTEKGPTGSAVLDRQYAYDDMWNVFRDTVRDLQWFIELLPALRWDTDHMLDHAGAHWAQATDVAGALVKEQGLPWRTAHQIVGILVRLTLERGIAPRDVTVDLLDEAAVEYQGHPVGLGAEALAAALDPVNFVHGRALYGGPAPTEVRDRLADFRAALERDEAEVETVAAPVREAGPRLEAAVDAVLAKAEEAAAAPAEVDEAESTAGVEDAAVVTPSRASAKRVTTRALVVGAGAGGLAAALALRRAGIEVDVFGSASSATTTGATVLSRDLVARLGVEPVLDRAPVVEWEEFWSSGGKSMARLPVGEVTRDTFVVSAADLIDVLRREVPCEPGRVVVAVEQDVTGVTLRFADGSEERGAVAIGADGAESLVRAATGRGRFLAWHGSAASGSVPPGVVRVFLGRGASFLAAGVGGGRVAWTGVKAVEQDRGPGVSGVKRDVLDHFRGWKDPVQALLERTLEEDVSREAAVAHQPGAPWSAGRLTAVGAAAHVPPVALGHTIRGAVEDALALAEELGRTNGLSDQAGLVEALAAYQQRRTPNGAPADAEARGREDMLLWAGRAKCAARDATIRLTSDKTWRRRLVELYGGGQG